MKVKCSVCGRDRDKSTCEVIVPTPEEVEGLRKMGEANPTKEHVFCRPCFRILQNPVTAQALMRGVVRSFAKSIGSPNADELADRFQKELSAKSKPAT